MDWNDSIDLLRLGLREKEPDARAERERLTLVVVLVVVVVVVTEVRVEVLSGFSSTVPSLSSVAWLYVGGGSRYVSVM